MSWRKDVGRSVRERTFLIFAEMIGEPIADSRPFTGNTSYHMKIRNKRHKVNKNKIRLKNIGQNKWFMIVS